MKKLLLIATGGTIASKYTEKGLSPPDLRPKSCSPMCRPPEISVKLTPSSLSAWTVPISARPQWLALAALIEKSYISYDGFVICHGTDTMAYTAAALSYLIQNSPKPIVVTGAQKPIDLAITDARANLLDSLRFASHDRAHGVNYCVRRQCNRRYPGQKKSAPRATMLFPALITLRSL